MAIFYWKGGTSPQGLWQGQGNWWKDEGFTDPAGDYPHNATDIAVLTTSAVENITEFGENILVEGGIEILKELLAAEVIDQLYLTISAKTGGENIYDLSALTRNFTVESSKKIEGETFLKLIRN